MTWLNELLHAPRLRLEADLVPAQGERFQPTGFPDLGAATYRLPPGPDGRETPMLLVESAQSVANRLEAVCWDAGEQDLVPELRGLPYVRVQVQGEDGGELGVTASVLEAHRLNSPYILDARPPGGGAPFRDTLRARAGIPARGKRAAADGSEEEEAGTGVLNLRRVAQAVFHYDPAAVLHGVFLTSLDGRARLVRALSGFIEARNVREVVSGGVKFDRVHAGGKTEEGYGNVPYARVEYVAERITAYFSLDLALLRSYGLHEEAVRLLAVLALWKIRRFLDTGLRLRTACDLALVGALRVSEPEGAMTIPGTAELAGELTGCIAACQGQWALPAITELVFGIATKSAREKGKKS